MRDKLFLKPTFRAQLEDIMEKLRTRKVDLGIKHIIILPDRVTLTAESLLCDTLGGAFDVSVMTFNRLFVKYVPSDESYLSSQGSVMLIKKLLAENSAKLKCFTKSSQKKGFSQVLYETLSMLIGCNVSPQLLDGMHGKDADLRLIYQLYLDSIKGKMLDAGGRLSLLENYLDSSDFLLNAHIYICCFDNITPRQRAIIDVMNRRALSVSEYALSQRPSDLGDIELYFAPSKVTIAKAAVAQIAGLIKRGESPDDICIVTGDGQADEMTRILDENGLPHSATASIKLSRHYFGRLLSSAINAAIRGQRSSDVIKLSKNILAGVSKRDSDCFERYVEKYNISYKLFSSPFPKGDNENKEDIKLRESAERVRKMLLPYINIEGERLLELVEKVTALAAHNYNDICKAADDKRANPLEKAVELASLVNVLLAGCDFKLQAEAFLEAMETVELASAPKRKNCIEIGDESSFRARPFKYVFVLDFDYDNHPRAIKDTSLISDDDIADMQSRGIHITPTTQEVNARQSEEFMQLLCGAQKVFLGYTQKVGSYFDNIKSEMNIRSIKNTFYDKESFILKSTDDIEVLLAACPTASLLKEELQVGRSHLRDGLTAHKLLPYIEKAVDAQYDDVEVKDTVENLGDISFKAHTSVSQIETYCKCPMMHFFRYALRAKVPDRGEMRPMDVGTILHSAADIYVKGGYKPADWSDVFDQSLAQYEEDKKKECDSKIKQILEKETRLLIYEIERQLGIGTFKPVETEMEIPNNSLTIDTGNRTLSFAGAIDRYDVSGNLVRVVDYKTGVDEFSLNDLYSGAKIQLFAYLGVLLALNENYQPAGAYYFKVEQRWDNEEMLLDGITASSDDALLAADACLARGEVSSVIKSKLSRGKLSHLTATTDQLRQLVAYSFGMIKNAAKEIEDGYKAQSPHSEKDCIYCDYADCCYYKGSPRRLPRAVLEKKESK